MVRARDIVAGYVAEPGLHPECAAYSAKACPMLAGTMARYRSSPLPSRLERCGNASCGCKAWVRPGDRGLRAGRPREAFAAVWIRRSEYRIRSGPVAGTPPGLTLRGLSVLKVRPVPPGPQDKWCALAAGVPRGSEWPPEIILIAALDLVPRSGPAG